MFLSQNSIHSFAVVCRRFLSKKMKDDSSASILQAFGVTLLM